MANTNGAIRVAALGDLHLRESSGGSLRELFQSISESADVLVLCGDLTDHGLVREAEILVEDLMSCKVPIVAVLGNHDYESGEHEEITRLLCRASVQVLNGDSCEILGIGFAGVKGFCGGFDNHMLQPWGEEPIKRFVYEAVEESLRLEGALAKLETQRKVAILHYSPIRQTVEGEAPEIIPYLGSSRLVEPIEHYTVSAVVHGHAHHGKPQGSTASGIPVYNTSLPLLRRVSAKRPFAFMEL